MIHKPTSNDDVRFVYNLHFLKMQPAKTPGCQASTAPKKLNGSPVSGVLRVLVTVVTSSRQLWLLAWESRAALTNMYEFRGPAMVREKAFQKRDLARSALYGGLI